jgi:predicted GNAT family N-acyltransferase
MSYQARSDFVDFVPPSYERIDGYDSSRAPHEQVNKTADLTKQIPQAFIDAMVVREEVFVREQGVPAANEFDADDRRSFHWVAYASMPSRVGDDAESANKSTRVPIGTVRVVPAPNAPHPENDLGVGDQGKESYVKIGRLAVIKDFRGMGIAQLLMRKAIEFIINHPGDVRLQLDAAERELHLQKNASLEFRGLILVHSQVSVEKVYSRLGFEKDESMGVWIEEGIEHVGMWRRVETVKVKD